MKKLMVIFLCLLLWGCDSGLSAGELLYFEYTETAPVFEYVWRDEELPDDFDPNSDFLYLNFSVGDDTRVLRINPYTLRTSELCMDPLCDHENRLGCPYFGMGSDYIIWDDVLYFVGEQYAKVVGYDGYIGQYREMDGSETGLNRYNFKSGEMNELVHHSDMCQPVIGMDMDFAFAEGYLYYYAESPDYDETGAEIREEDGDPVTETHLYRVKMSGKGRPEDLGLYLGYAELLIEDGAIWNYYGHFNESDFWKDVPENSWVLTDLNNENPVVIPEVREPLVDDPDGYRLADCADVYGTGSLFLLYTGEQAQRHVYRSQKEIMYYADGWVWTAEPIQEEWTDGGVIRSRQTGAAVRKTNIFTGESEKIPMPDCPLDAGYLNVSAVVDGRYLICAVHGVVNYQISNGSGVGYYLRHDTVTGETLPIYP